MRNSTLVSSLLAIALSFQSIVAHADGPRVESVVLADGSVYQGELVESVPGDHVSIRLATGEVKRFEARDLATPSTTASPSTAVTHTTELTHLTQLTERTTTTSLSVIGDSEPYRGESPVTVHVETNKPGETYLFQAARGGPSVGWRRVCLAPCDLPVDPDATYRIGGETVEDSRPFHLGDASSETLYVDASAAGTSAFGWVSFGLGAALTGPAMYLLLRHEDPTPYDQGPSGGEITGWVLLANGLPWLIAGAVMLGNSGTSVHVDDSSPTRTALAYEGISLGGGLHFNGSAITF